MPSRQHDRFPKVRDALASLDDDERRVALLRALEEYMKLQPIVQSYPTYKRLWNAADKALVPLRGGPMSMENRGTEPPKGPPSWR